MRKLLYVCAPFRNRSTTEVIHTDAAIRRALLLGWFPVFVPYALIGFLEDGDAEQREAGLQCCEVLIPRCDAMLVVPGDDSLLIRPGDGVSRKWTPGMIRDRAAWPTEKDSLVYTVDTLPRAHEEPPASPVGASATGGVGIPPSERPQPRKMRLMRSC